MNSIIATSARWIKAAIAACLLAATSASAADPATARLPGIWHAALQTPAGTFALEMTVTRSADGALAASLESIDQAPGQAISVSQVSVVNEQITLKIDAIAASFEGRYDAAKDRLAGTWHQGPILPLDWTRGPVPRQPSVAGIDGVWRATLTRDGRALRLILHVTTSARGTRAKLDSPDMGIAGMDVTELAREGGRVHLRVPLAKVNFDAELGEPATMSGAWLREGIAPVTVSFARDADGAGAPARPQASLAPHDYTEQQVQFTNPAAQIALAGTLTLPRGAGPFTAAVLISGSGPQDRDETIFGHRIFAVLADHLTRHGIAVLRFDDRGVGHSGGDFGSATNADFASDVGAAVAFLARQPGIDARAIGLIGHSQGGIVGPLVALRDPSIAYLVLMAAPATSMGELLLAQRHMAGALQGQNASTLTAADSALRQIYAATSQAGSRAQAHERVKALLTPDVLRQLGVAPGQEAVLADEFSGDWLRDVLRYNAPATLAQLRMPILAINGSLDRQVPSEPNLAAIGRATASNPDVTRMQLAGLNHLFQHARSGAIAEYRDIAETFAPTALEAISGWIGDRFGPTRARLALGRDASAPH